MAYNKDATTGNGLGPVRKKLKTSDIPLSSATRQSIDDLAHKFKKKGGYDSLRKQVWEDLEKSVRFPTLLQGHRKTDVHIRDRTSKRSSSRT